jgi:hypothetical protein
MTEDLNKKDSLVVSFILVFIIIIIIFYLIYLKFSIYDKNIYIVQYVEPKNGGWTYIDAKKLANSLGGRIAEEEKVNLDYQGWVFGRKLGSNKTGWQVIPDDVEIKAGFYYFGMPLSSTAKEHIYS